MTRQRTRQLYISRPSIVDGEPRFYLMDSHADGTHFGLMETLCWCRTREEALQVKAEYESAGE